MADIDTYQWRLRALGAFLDTQAAVDASVIEARQGFALRYYRRSEQGDPLFVLIEQPQLRAITEALQQRRTDLAPEDRTAQHPGRITEADHYQDLFRALGWELDDLHGRNIVIDERGAELYLSYALTDSTTGEWTRKRMANLGQEQCQAILDDARRRRRL